MEVRDCLKSQKIKLSTYDLKVVLILPLQTSPKREALKSPTGDLGVSTAMLLTNSKFSKN